jgi:hypothetical protein
MARLDELLGPRLRVGEDPDRLRAVIPPAASTLTVKSVR